MKNFNIIVKNNIGFLDIDNGIQNHMFFFDFVFI